jgi:hypothetical protein
MKSPFTLFIAIFGTVGLVMLTVGVGVAVSTVSFRMHAQQTEGTVVDLVPRHGSEGGTTYSATFEFKDLGGNVQRVTTGSSSNPAPADVGDKVTVWFDPEHPDEARMSGFMENWFLPLIFGFFGVVFTGIAAGFSVAIVRKARRRAELLRIGRRTPCRLVRVEPDTSIRINGRHPWRLKVQWQDPYTGKTHTYRSDTLYQDPTGRVGDTIDVLVDPHDPRKYWVDVSALQ